MPAKYILAALAIVFLLAGAFGRIAGRPAAQSRTWLLVGTIFAIVSLFLFTQS